MLDVHPPIFKPYVGTSSEESKPDPSMATPTYSLEMDPSKPTSLFALPLKSVMIPSTMGSRDKWDKTWTWLCLHPYNSV